MSTNELLINTAFESALNINQTFSTHYHNSYAIGITYNGLFKSTKLNKSELSYKNSTRVINPGEIHGGLAQEWSNSYFYPNIELMCEIYEQMFQKRNVPLFKNHIIDDFTLYSKLYTFFQAIYFKHDSLEIESKLIDALSFLIKKYTCDSKPIEHLFNHKRVIKNSVELINDTLNEKLSLQELADNIGISQYHFLRIFKKETGLTPHQYILNRRVEKAKELIIQGRPLLDSALSVGFADQSHFIRSFKRFYAYTPSALIKNSNIILYK